MLEQLDSLLHQFADWTDWPYDIVVLGLIGWAVTIFLGLLGVADQVLRGKVGFRGALGECVCVVLALPMLLVFLFLVAVVAGMLGLMK